MPSVARARESSIATQWSAFVIARKESVWTVQGAHGELPATRAFSCLVEPSVNDRVLCVTTEEGASFILAILERTTQQSTTRVGLSSGAGIELSNDSVAIHAANVSVHAAQSLEMTTEHVQLQAAKGNVFVHVLEVLGGAVRGEWSAIKTVAETCDSVFERLSQRVKRMYRSSEELEQVRATRMDYTAKETLSMHAENAIVTATELVKVDANQIHLG